MSDFKIKLIDFNYYKILTHLGDSEKVFVVKIFLSILILIFGIQPFSIAENISEFEIEGMSIGDSLLNFSSKRSIKNEIDNRDNSVYYEDKFVSVVVVELRRKLEIYEEVKAIINPKDKTYQIVALEGILTFEDINECYKNQVDISKEIKDSLNLAVNPEQWNLEKSRLPPTIKGIRFIDLNLNEDLSLGSFRTACYDYETGKDLLMVIINSSEFDLYLQETANN